MHCNTLISAVISLLISGCTKKKNLSCNIMTCLNYFYYNERMVSRKLVALTIQSIVLLKFHTLKHKWCRTTCRQTKGSCFPAYIVSHFQKMRPVSHFTCLSSNSVGFTSPLVDAAALATACKCYTRPGFSWKTLILALSTLAL